MNRREFLVGAGSASLSSSFPLCGWAQGDEPLIEHCLPTTDADYQRSRSYIEEVPVHQYHWASDRAVEAFKDMKFGLRIHGASTRSTADPGNPGPFLPFPWKSASGITWPTVHGTRRSSTPTPG
jgi:hypothetical protein